MFAMPFILLMAVSGLVILYTQPIEDATQGSIRSVAAGEEMKSFDDQAAAVAAAYPEATVLDLTPPASPGRASRFFVDDGTGQGEHVFVDPYTAKVLGEVKPGSGIVGLANRLHGTLNNETVTVPLPTVSALWDGEAVWRDYAIGDLVLELLGVWTLVLIATGFYLYLPRTSRHSNGSKGARRVFGIRRGARGRARWRDLHGLAGVSLLAVMALTIVSGMAWSTYWSANFTSLADKVNPPSVVEPPASALGERGDLDRFGNQIPWATGDFPIPASYAPIASDGTVARPLRLDDVVRIAQTEGMKPGYTIVFPENTADEAGNPLYGSFTLFNSWPRKTGEARDLFIDQFSGATLAEQRVYGAGEIRAGMDTLVSVHMGTQLGLFNRILMTLLCVLAIWSVISGFAMFWKRRRPGTLGVPNRPADVSLPRRLGIIAAAIGVVFPQWAVSALAVLAFDRFVIRRIRPLRTAFGQA
jgi:uncharacterized iron-regulated membrane protein